TTKQTTGRDCLPAPISDQGVGSQPYAEINPIVSQVGKPLFANKLTVCTQIINRRKVKQAIKIFQQLDTLGSIGAPFLFEDSPQKREGYPFIAYAKCHNIQRCRAQVPIRAIHSDGPGRGQSNQFNDKQCEPCIADFKEPKESLNAFVVGRGLGVTGESRCHLNEVDGLNLNQCDQELGQEVDTSFVPSYIFSKRSLKQANVGHCVGSFQDTFGDDLDKDSGTMAFYAFSKIDFCPVLSGLTYL
ncbi:MAG TPA: hypothetical protein VE262_05795, partial [Blastocatellia bacterium]|nr:hypothetical protein [Blastocatellia bacterium]